MKTNKNELENSNGDYWGIYLGMSKCTDGLAHTYAPTKWGIRVNWKRLVSAKSLLLEYGSPRPGKGLLNQ